MRLNVEKCKNIDTSWQRDTYWPVSFITFLRCYPHHDHQSELGKLKDLSYMMSKFLQRPTTKKRLEVSEKRAEICLLGIRHSSSHRTQRFYSLIDPSINLDALFVCTNR